MTDHRNPRPSDLESNTPSGRGEVSPGRQPPDIPDHELIKVIGRGSYGEVWLARTTTGSFRAVKVVYRKRFESDKPYEREFTGIKEFEPISRSHPAQIDILHVGRNEDAGYFYYVLELADDDSTEDQPTDVTPIAKMLTLESAAESAAPPATTGTSLARVIDPESYTPRTLHSLLRARSRLPVAECLPIALALAEALDHLHVNGLVHRDIKPSNVIFVHGRPKLADIGLVARSDATLSFVGTEGYLPPEGPGKPQADIYSLGIVLYEMATGRDRNDFPQPPVGIEQAEDHEAFLEFNEIVLRACENSIERRYQTAMELRHDLLVLKTGKSVRRLHSFESRLSQLKKIAAGFLVLTAIALTATIYQRIQTREARRLAAANLELAKREVAQRQRAEAAVRRHELQEIEQMFETDQTSQALALLVQRVRTHTNDTFAARRLLSALTFRNYGLPMAEFRHESPEQYGFFTKMAGEDISPDQRTLATLTLGGTLTLWDFQTAQPLFETHVRQPEVQSSRHYPNVQFNRQGTLVITPGGTEKALRIWQVDPPRALALEIDRPGNTGNFCHAEFSPDGERVAAFSQEGKGFIWEVATGNQLVAFDEEPDKSVRHVVCRFTPDGEHLITAMAPDEGRDRSNRILTVRNSRTGELLNRREDSNYASGQFLLWKDTISLAPKKPRLGYLSGNGFVEIWDYLQDTSVTAKMKHTDGPIRSLVFSPNGDLVASGGDDDMVRLWELRSDELRLLHTLENDGNVISLAFSPDGSCLASGTIGETIRVWDVKTGQPLSERMQHGSAPVHLEFLKNDDALISISGSSAWIWDVRPSAARPNLIVHQAEGDKSAGFVGRVWFSPDGQRLVTSLGPSGWRSLWSQVWDPFTGKPLSDPVAKDNSATTIVITPDGSRALTALDRGFTLWDARNGTMLKRVENLEFHPDLLAISPDGRWALAGDPKRRTELWDLENQRALWNPKWNEYIIAAAFSPDSSRVFLVAANPGLGSVRNSETGETLFSFKVKSTSTTISWYPAQAHWSPDQQILAFAQRQQCHFYEATSGKSIVVDSLTHNSVILSSGFSADSRYFVTTSKDQTARLWDPRLGKQVARDLRHEDVVQAAAFSPNGLDVATASYDGSARLWDRDTGLPLTGRLSHPDKVLSVHIDPTGRWLATGCQDRIARLWELPQAETEPPGWLLELAEWMGGLTVNASDSLEEIADPEAILDLKARLNSTPPDTDDEYLRWGRWFFADRDTRPLSPHAQVGMETYRERMQELEGGR